MYDNPYQTKPEPTNQEVWYSQSIRYVEGNREQNPKLNRYKHKLRLTDTSGVKFIEFQRRSQLYIPESSDDIYYYVDVSRKFRPDLIAQEVYGTPVLYWVILSCNNLRHPLDLETGLTVRIPPLQSVIHDEKVM